ncbi:MAG: GNAT family N-acetyltransferase, partial [Methanomicrobiaceae archaeon]|nr:GNAT family N-acetyltransferase [Methanomicrobiaceae archaeon]
MSLTVSIATKNDAEQWDAAVESAQHGTLFHTWRWLRIVEKHTGTTLYPLMCFKGTHLVAIYPVFLRKKGVITIAQSPPGRAYLVYLGPVIANYDALKQNKKETALIAVQKEIDAFLFSTLGCTKVEIHSSPLLPDSRPFQWAGYHVEPRHTYRIDLTHGAGYVWEQFDRKLRVDIKKTEKEGVIIEEGGFSDIDFFHNAVSGTINREGLQISEHRAYLADLYEAFHPSNMKIYVAWYKDERVGGMITLLDKGVMYLWVGVPKCTIRGISPNDLAQWKAISWACAHGFNYYELIDTGAYPRLRPFKSKYNPELEIFYS